MKRYFSILLCLSMLLSLMLCGCGDNNDAQPTTIKATQTSTATVAATTVVTTKATAAKTTEEYIPDEIEKTTQKPKLTEAMKFAQKIKCGWNLGNTLEATGRRSGTLPEKYSVTDIETGWGNPKTTKAMFDKVKSAGFNAARIPVSWCRFINKKNGKYVIREDFLKRVKEVVNYGYNNGMYVIINIHHDDAYEEWLHISGSDSEFSSVKTEFKQIWTQIANYFKSYGERLIFEMANEPIGYYDDGTGDWNGGEPQYFVRLDELYKIFVNTVRATGGNNKSRYLMIPTYGAQSGSQIYYVKIPNNDAHVLVDIHYYTDGTNQGALEDKFKQIAEYGRENGIAFILGECGIRANSDPDTLSMWTLAFVRTASEYGLRCFVWDDGGDYQVLDRKGLTWVNSAYVSSFVKNAVKMSK